MPSEAPAVKEAAVEAPAEEPSIDALFGPADSGDADTKDTPADDYAALIDDIFGQHRSIESESQVPAMPVSTAVGQSKWVRPTLIGLFHLKILNRGPGSTIPDNLVRLVG